MDQALVIDCNKKEKQAKSHQANKQQQNSNNNKSKDVNGQSSNQQGESNNEHYKFKKIPYAKWNTMTDQQKKDHCKKEREHKKEFNKNKQCQNNNHSQNSTSSPSTPSTSAQSSSSAQTTSDKPPVDTMPNTTPANDYSKTNKDESGSLISSLLSNSHAQQSSPESVSVNGKTYYLHLTYRIQKGKAQNLPNQALIDCGTNGGFVGANMHKILLSDI